MSKTKTTTTTASADQVPPYSFYLPGMAAEEAAEAAEAAVKALRTPYLCDALAILWELRRVSKKEQAERSSAIKNATESVSGEFPALPQALPPINPTQRERNNA